MKGKPIVLIEFNELCPNLLNKWMADGNLQNFKEFYNSSQAFITKADVQDGLHLEPWIQWYSLHTGLSYQQHKVFNLTDGPKAGHEDIWDILSENNLRVANFSSMNAKPIQGEGCVFLPDPWCTTEKPFPSELNVFHNFVSRTVQEYTNINGHKNLRDPIIFLTFLLAHGLRIKTSMQIVGQLVSEVTVKRNSSWKRAPLLDKLQFDIFRYYYHRLRPDFSTFFTNSTAHFQHCYWRHMDPEPFTVKPSVDEVKRYRGAILYGYQEMDKLLGEFFKLEAKGAALILATGLSQQPYLKHESKGGQNFYRLKNLEGMLEELGISYEMVLPVMAHQFQIRFKDDFETEKAGNILKGPKYQGKDVFWFDQNDPKTLSLICQVTTDVPENGKIGNYGSSSRSIEFYKLFYRLPEMKSGFHHPDGVLWFKTGKHKVYKRKASILDVLPTILNYFDIDPQFSDGFPRLGKDLGIAFE